MVGRSIHHGAAIGGTGSRVCARGPACVLRRRTREDGVDGRKAAVARRAPVDPAVVPSAWRVDPQQYVRPERGGPRRPSSPARSRDPRVRCRTSWAPRPGSSIPNCPASSGRARTGRSPQARRALRSAHRGLRRALCPAGDPVAVRALGHCSPGRAAVLGSVRRLQARDLTVPSFGAPVPGGTRTGLTLGHRLGRPPRGGRPPVTIGTGPAWRPGRTLAPWHTTARLTMCTYAHSRTAKGGLWPR